MIFYPAIDLKDGKCVRLLKGDMKKVTIFNDSPAKQAKEFYDAGCNWLHVVDLDGAVAGKSVNGDAVRDILKACPKMKIQLGGGIRDMKMVEYWLKAGIKRVILGTAAVKKPDFTREAAKEFPNLIALGIDAKGGFVATNGWTNITSYTAGALARMYKKDNIAAIIYTDIERDGAMKGPNIRATKDIAETTNIPVIASGGVSKLEDLWALRGHGGSLNGVISGRALYDGKLDVKEALKAVKSL